MKPTRGGSLQRSFTGSVVTGGLRLLSALAAMCVFSVTAALGQEATYTDMWSAETPNDESVVFMEDLDGFVAGCGVTEDDYGYYSYKVQTVMRSPSGRTASGVSYGDVGLTRIDVSLPVDLEYPEEGEYAVDTTHYYKAYSGGGGGYREPIYMTSTGSPETEVASANVVVSGETPDGGAAAPAPIAAPATTYQTTYQYGGATRALGFVNGYRVMYKYHSRVGNSFWYIKQCESIVCSLPSSKYVSTSKWAYPRTFLNCSGFRMSVNLGFFRVVGCVGGCVGTELYSGCR